MFQFSLKLGLTAIGRALGTTEDRQARKTEEAILGSYLFINAVSCWAGVMELSRLGGVNPRGGNQERRGGRGTRGGGQKFRVRCRSGGDVQRARDTNVEYRC